MSLKTYLRNLLIGLDQGINTLMGGDPDETLSSRWGKEVARCAFCRWVCRVLDYFDTGHCQKSIEPDRGEPLP